MSAQLIKIVQRLAQERRGAITLLTLVFLLLVGIISVVFLWSISIITGAYNTLYIANQNAAIAAVSTASADNGAQPEFQCDPPAQEMGGASTACSLPTSPAVSGDPGAVEEIESAPAVFAARAVMRNALANEPFGLRFVDSAQGLKNVQFIPEPGFAAASNREYVLRFTVSESRGTIRNRLAAGASCSIPGNRYRGILSDTLLPSPDTIHCWQIKERGVNFAKQFNSGVITRARARLSLFNNCPIPGSVQSIPLICGEQTIVVSAAATLRQLQGADSWEDFYYLTP